MSKPLTEQERLMFKIARIKVPEDDSTPEILEDNSPPEKESLTEQERLNEIMYKRAGLKPNG